MSSIRIILDLDKELDGIVAGTEIALTFAAAKFNSLVSRGGTLSNKFTIAKTANNKHVLGVLEDVNDTKDSPYKLYDVQILVDDNSVFKGLATIDEAQDTYGIRVFGGIANFFELVGDKSIQELDISSFNHAWTAANVQAGKQRVNTQGYVYPNINYGRWTNQSLAARPHTDFYPAIWFRALFEQAAIDHGYTMLNYDSQRAIPFSKKDFEQIDVRVEASNSASQTLTIDNVNPEFRFAEFDTVTLDPFSFVVQVPNAGTKDYTQLSFTQDGTIEVRLEFDYSRTGGTSDVVVTFEETPTGNSAAAIVIPPGASGSAILQGSMSFSGALSNIVLQVKGATVGDDVDISAGATLSVQAGRLKIKSGNTIPLRDTLPDIKIKDLFLFEAVKTNSLLITDPIAKTLEFVSINSIRNAKASALDWSHKADTLTEPKREYRLNEYAQNNFLRYKEGIDEDPAFAANNNLGLGNFQVADRALKLDRDWYTAPFSGSGISGAFTDETAIIRIPRYSDTALTYDEPDLDPQPRVLDVSIDDSFLVNITGQSVLTTQANVTFEGFDQSVTNDYEALTAIFDKMKLVEVYVNLNDVDIANLDITRPVFLLNAYWFIREISQYRVTSKESTKVKLIRL